MIKTLKQTISEMYNWIKEKVIKFKKWIIALIFGSVILASSLPAEIPIEYVTAPENNTYKIGVKNFQDEFKENIIDDKPLQYKLDDKYISFKPTEMKWDNVVLTTAKSSIKDDKKYSSIFGRGIDLKMKTGERVWSKIISIDKLNNLGKIPDGTEFLEIEYEVDTNFIINGWNKKDIIEITETTRLGDYSYIEPAYSWDSYNETICKEKEICEDICDIDCVSDLDGCDVCECNTEEVCETYNNKVQIKSYFKNKDDKLIYTKQIPVEWIKTAQFPIRTDADITYGTAKRMSMSNSEHHNIVVLENQFVLCSTVTSSLYCQAATVSGTTITTGTSVYIDTDVETDSTYSQVGACKLGADKFVVVYADDGAGDDGYAEVMTVSGTTITEGNFQEFHSTDVESLDCAQLDTDKYAIFYNNETGGDDDWYVIATVSGTTSSFGTPAEISSTHHYGRRAAQLGTDSAVYCYESVTDACRVCDATGTVFSCGSVAAYDSHTYFTSIGVASLADDYFAVTWHADSSYRYLALGSVSGTTITYGSKGTIDDDCDYSGLNTNGAVAYVDSTHVVTSWQDGADNSYGKSSYTTISGTSISSIGTAEAYTSVDAFTSERDRNQDVALFSANKIVICYVDDTDSDYSNCIIGDIGEAPPEARRMFLIQ